jgi:hypothetical protein
MTREQEFEQQVIGIITRYFEQNARTVPPAQVARVARQLQTLVAERGLPRPLGEDERGVPGGMSESECAPLVTRVTAGTDDPLLAEAARQLVKSCFYPEFKDCRDSFRAVAVDGSCRRQELERVRGRLSGSHCIDCPHWVGLAAEAHRVLLGREWRGDARILDEHQGIFLPEDFRRWRNWLHAAARRG